jgi:hypothetical protein
MNLGAETRLDEGGVWEGGRLRRKVEEDLGK